MSFTLGALTLEQTRHLTGADVLRGWKMPALISAGRKLSLSPNLIFPSAR
jgi:hypothetical protein